MTKITLVAAVFSLLACVGPKTSLKEKMVDHGDPAHPLFVGHDTTGQMVLASTHYDAMGGMAVMASDIGMKGNDQMLCEREVLTGSHVPNWVCRYKADMDMERAATRDWLDKPRNCQSGCGGPLNNTHK